MTYENFRKRRPNTKGPSAKVKEKMKVARAALKHLAKVGMGSGVIKGLKDTTLSRHELSKILRGQKIYRSKK